MIPQRNLSLLSNRLARDGGRRIPEAVLERDYCIAWFLVGLARTALRERLAFKGGTAIKRCYFGGGTREMKVDVTIRERLVLPLEERSVLRGYEEYEDLPEDARVRVYSLGEIAVEKVVALFDRARNEPRDLYDLWYLTSGGHVDLGDLVAEIEDKLEFRGGSLQRGAEEFRRKEARYKKLWSTRLAAQMASLPSFDNIFRGVRRELRQAGLVAP